MTDPTPYATYVDLIARYDVRTICQLVNDTDQEILPTDLPDDPNVAAALNDASGEIDSALLVGGMYSVEDLQNVTGNSQYKLKSICCEIAMTRLMARRPAYQPERYKAAMEISEARLTQLRKGENLFAIANNQGNVEAGLANPAGPSIAVRQGELLRETVRNYYPVMRNRRGGCD